MAKRSIAVRVGAKTSEFDKGLIKVRKTLLSLRNAANTVGKGLSTTFRGVTKVLNPLNAGLGTLAAAAGVGGASTAIYKLAENSANAADKVGKLADQTGISVESLQTLRFAAEQSGVGADQMNMAFQRFNRRLGLFVSEGGGPAATAIKGLGIETRNSLGEIRPTEAVLRDVISRLTQLDTEAEQAALASQLFGEDAGPKLVPLLQQGQKGIKELEDQAVKLGNVFTYDQTRHAANFGDAINRLKTAFDGVVGQIGQVFIPKLTELADFLTEWVVANRDQIINYVEKGWDFAVASVKDFIALFRSGGEAQTALTWTKDAYDAFVDVKTSIADLYNFAKPKFQTMARLLRDVANTLEFVLVNGPRAAVSQVLGDGSVTTLSDGKLYEYNRPAFANGGLVDGPGTGTSDSILARVSNGEYVMRAAAVQHYGAGLMSAINNLRLPRFADGGPVTNDHSTSISGITVMANDPETLLRKLNDYAARGGRMRLNAGLVAPRGVR